MNKKRRLGLTKAKRHLQRKRCSFRGEKEVLLHQFKRQQPQLQTGKESNKGIPDDFIKAIQLLLLLLQLFEEIKNFF